MKKSAVGASLHDTVSDQILTANELQNQTVNHLTKTSHVSSRKCEKEKAFLAPNFLYKPTENLHLKKFHKNIIQYHTTLCREVCIKKLFAVNDQYWIRKSKELDEEL